MILRYVLKRPVGGGGVSCKNKKIPAKCGCKEIF